MLLLHLLLQQDDEVSSGSTRPKSSSVNDLFQNLGLSIADAAKIAGYASKQNLQKAISGEDSTIEFARWEIFELTTCSHPTLDLFNKDSGKKIEFDAKNHNCIQQLIRATEIPTPAQILETRLCADLSQTSMSRLIGVTQQVTIAAYESGKIRMDGFKWQLLKLKLGLHPTFELSFKADHLKTNTAQIENEFIGAQIEAISLIRETMEKKNLSLLDLLSALDPVKYGATEFQFNDDQSETIFLISETLDDHDLTPENLLPRRSPRLRLENDVRVGAREYRYVDPKSGKRWSGRGRTPDWVKVELANGKSLDFFVPKM